MRKNFQQPDRVHSKGTTSVTFLEVATGEHSSGADRWINALILVGSGMFVFGLAVSAAFAPEWRVL